jgi:hypothetical protein
MDQNTNTTPKKQSSLHTFNETTAKTAGVVVGIYAGLFVVGTVKNLFAKFNEKTPSDTTEE